MCEALLANRCHDCVFGGGWRTSLHAEWQQLKGTRQEQSKSISSVWNDTMFAAVNEKLDAASEQHQQTT